MKEGDRKGREAWRGLWMDGGRGGSETGREGEVDGGRGRGGTKEGGNYEWREGDNLHICNYKAYNYNYKSY